MKGLLKYLKKGFTIIEMLVVVAIISALLYFVLTRIVKIDIFAPEKNIPTLQAAYFSTLNATYNAATQLNPVTWKKMFVDWTDDPTLNKQHLSNCSIEKGMVKANLPITTKNIAIHVVGTDFKDEIQNQVMPLVTNLNKLNTNWKIYLTAGNKNDLFNTDATNFKVMAEYDYVISVEHNKPAEATCYSKSNVVGASDTNKKYFTVAIMQDNGEILTSDKSRTFVRELVCKDVANSGKLCECKDSIFKDQGKNTSVKDTTCDVTTPTTSS